MAALLSNRVHSWKSGSYYCWPCWVNCTTLFQAQQVHTCPLMKVQITGQECLGMTVCNNLVGVWSCLSGSRRGTETLITRVTACAGCPLPGWSPPARLRSCSDREQPRHQPISLDKAGSGNLLSGNWEVSVGGNYQRRPHPSTTHGDLCDVMCMLHVCHVLV